MIATPPPPPARVQVVAREFRLSLSRVHVKAGKAVVELVNMGEDAHDLKLRRKGTWKVVSFPTTAAGGHVDRDMRLTPGTYLLWCSLPGHRALGMQAVLQVEGKKRRRARPRRARR
ncbi:MAG TPA: hypothetical protein VFJ77_04385 [Gaiellaceae bacterium]|nr:hypothetical protein [Gaiellaceae bacterium]